MVKLGAVRSGVTRYGWAVRDKAGSEVWQKFGLVRRSMVCRGKVGGSEWLGLVKCGLAMSGTARSGDARQGQWCGVIRLCMVWHSKAGQGRRSGVAFRGEFRLNKAG